MREAALHRPAAHNERIAASLRGRLLSAEHIEAQRKTKMATGTWNPIGHAHIRRGYRWIKVAEGQGRANYRAEHRFVIEQHIGHELSADEHVHHINGDRLDNRLDNLAVVSKSDHTLITKLLRCVDESLARVIISTLTARFPHLGS